MINLLDLNKRLGCIIAHKMWVITPPNLNHYMSSGDAANKDTKTTPSNSHSYYQS